MSGTFAESTIVGYLGHDIEVNYDEAGTAYTTMNLAVHTKENGEQATTWIKVSAKDRLAETAAKYASKGQRILATGQLKSRKVMPKNGKGNGRVVYYVCADHMRLMD